MGAVAVAAGAAAIKLGKEVVQQFGELEQDLGGSEAVFGAYAESIQKTGEEAYKNLGVSQSEYLATPPNLQLPNHWGRSRTVFGKSGCTAEPIAPLIF